jgi:histidyl-tRNA synthetase
VSFLGGPEVPGIGFAVGFERLIACMPQNEINKFQTDIFIAAMGPRAQKISFSLTNELRRAGISAMMDYSDKSLKSQMKKADRSGANYVLIIGDKELEQGAAVLRNMTTKEQTEILMENVLENVTAIVRR